MLHPWTPGTFESYACGASAVLSDGVEASLAEICDSSAGSIGIVQTSNGAALGGRQIDRAMSRSSFADRFTKVAGVPPVTYLFRSRMRQAERALADGSASITGLAMSLGYRSESAFSVAFKRWSGIAPSRFRQRDPQRDPAEQAVDPNVA